MPLLVRSLGSRAKAGNKMSLTRLRQLSAPHFLPLLFFSHSPFAQNFRTFSHVTGIFLFDLALPPFRRKRLDIATTPRDDKLALGFDWNLGSGHD